MLELLDVDMARMHSRWDRTELGTEVVHGVKSILASRAHAELGQLVGLLQAQQ